MVAKAEGWDKQLENMPGAASTEDAHRSEIIIGMMDEIAKRMKEQRDLGVGFVGSPLSYEEGSDGIVVAPGRMLVHSTEPSRSVAEEEIARLLEPYKNLEQLYYRTGIGLRF
jgi:hypothetical protein